MNKISESKADISNTKLKSNRIYLISTRASPSAANKPVLLPALAGPEAPLSPNPISHYLPC